MTPKFLRAFYIVFLRALYCYFFYAKCAKKFTQRMQKHKPFINKKPPENSGGFYYNF